MTMGMTPGNYKQKPRPPTSEPETAEERVKVVHLGPEDYRVVVDGKKVSPSLFKIDAQRLATHWRTSLQSMHDDTRAAAVRECCVIIDSIRVVSQRDGSVHYSANPIEAIYAETGVTP